MDGPTDALTDGRTDGWTDGRTDGQMDGWTDRWTDGRTDRPSYRDAWTQLKKIQCHNFDDLLDLPFSGALIEGRIRSEILGDSKKGFIW